MFTFPENKDSNIVIVPTEKTSFLSTYTMGEGNLDTYTIDITKVEMKDIILRGALNYLRTVLHQLGN